jgi:dienelactone hydrolase
MKSLTPVILFIALLVGCHSTPKKAPHHGPWNLNALKQAPAAEWGSLTGLVQEVYYQGELYHGKPTRVFGYLSRPATGKGPFPAMVLVHGGGGKAFRDWAEHWAKRGYVALAMDTAGNGPKGRLPDGGPDQKDDVKFCEFTRENDRDMWSYHAVAAVIRGHSLLRTLPEVDVNRIGITGISWGGYLTCIVSGLDDRLKVAVPVYGCGFLGENSVWKNGSLAKLHPETRELWLQEFDPSQYLGNVRCPILFLNGSNDFAYPMDSYRTSYRLVPLRYRNVSVILNLRHGHYWDFNEVDTFVDSVLLRGTPLARFDAMKTRDDVASARISSPVRVKKAELHFTNDTGEWQKRRWETLPANIEGNTVSAILPQQRPIVWFLAITDERGLRVSTEHEEKGL